VAVELREALSHIAEIRARAAAAERFRGYRAVPIGTSGLLALFAAAAQPYLVPEPAADLAGYLALWLTTAVVGAAAAGSGLFVRHWSARHPLSRELTRLAVGQFAPCLVAGALVTLALARHAPEVGWMLPGLWQIIFALGMFASCRLLPRAIAGVAMFFLLAGAINLTRGSAALSPWAMGVPFGLGQIATATVLYWNLERDHAE
jgi:hypothetical protein